MSNGGFFYLLSRTVPLLYAPRPSSPLLRGVVQQSRTRAVVAVTADAGFADGLAVAIDWRPHDSGHDIDAALPAIWSLQHADVTAMVADGGRPVDAHRNRHVTLSDLPARRPAAPLFGTTSLAAFLGRRIGMGDASANSDPPMLGFMLLPHQDCRVYFMMPDGLVGIDVSLESAALGSMFMTEVHYRLADEGLTWLRPVTLTDQDPYCGPRVFRTAHG